jgi:hypothetical protein
MFQHRSDREYCLLLESEMQRRRRGERGGKVRTRSGRDSLESSLGVPPTVLR